MANEDGKKIIENVSIDVLDEAVKVSKLPITREDIAKTIVDRDLAESSKPDKKVPEGHVTRTLSCRDRNLIIGACRAYVKGESRGKHKNQFKVDRVIKLLIEPETTEYFSMINDAQAESLFRWQEARQAYVAFRMMKGGMIKPEEFSKTFPDLDVDECPTKPSIQQPRLTEDEQRGPTREFHIPSKIDAFIEEALRDMEWGSIGSEQVVELMERYGIDAETERK